MTKVINFLRSTNGHGLAIVVMAFLLILLTTDLFSEVIHEIKPDWSPWLCNMAGLLFAMGLEFGILFLAINGYIMASIISAFFSVILALSTFLEIRFAVPYILGLFPSVFVAYLSHHLVQKVPSNPAYSPSIEIADSKEVVRPIVRAKRTHKECINCGEKFDSVQPNRKYCSDKCRKAYARQNQLKNTKTI